jgi:hypothetical protein
MDVLFDAVDRALETVRRRWPAALMAVGGILWVLATAAVVAVAVLNGALISGAVLIALPTILLVVVAVRGLDRTKWPFWLVGVALPVFLAGLVPPQAPRFAEPFDWVIPVLVFVYAQVFLAIVTAGDELYRRRTAPSPAAAAPSPASPSAASPPASAASTSAPSASPSTSASASADGQAWPELSDFGQRRVLQTKLLVATLVVIGASQAAVGMGVDSYTAGNATGRSGFEFGIACVALPMLIGVWLRVRGLAWYSVIVLPTVFALSLLPRTPDARWEAVLSQGWIVVAAAWQWGKAARKEFWRFPPAPPVPPAPATYLPDWAPGYHYPAGSVAMFAGVPWECRLGHTSLPGWQPPQTPSLWQRWG